MNSVSVSRTVAASPDAVRQKIRDVGPFMRAADFDDVVVDDGLVVLTNGVGIATIELTLELFDDADSVLAYRQQEGIFDEMVTHYSVVPTDGGTEVTATTEFQIDVALVGALMDATIIKRQRKKELTAQFDWLQAELGE